MRKILMFGTMLGVATTALAFGGVFNHGSKSTTYKGGVDAIGVHFGGETTSPQEKVICSLPYTLNEEKNECECPAAQQCGETCCGEGNVCVDGNKCCYQDYDGNVDEARCCDASESIGYSDMDGTCCGEGSGSYVFWYSDLDMGKATACCVNNAVYRTYDFPYGEEQWYGQSCCEEPNMLYTGVGYKGRDVCCDHEPTDYTNNKGETFKVCWTENSECKTNDDCLTLGEGYYCNLDNNGNPSWTCNFPNNGVCNFGDSGAPATIAGLGNVIKSNNSMSWWAADNWCKAKGMRLASIEDIACYSSQYPQIPITNNFEEWTYCCAEGKSCDGWESSWNWVTNTIESSQEDSYSPIIVSLAKMYGMKNFWLTSNFVDSNFCGAFFVGLGRGIIDRDARDHADRTYYALCVED